VKIKFSVPCI
jgi:hypothetical protein